MLMSVVDTYSDFFVLGYSKIFAFGNKLFIYYFTWSQREIKAGASNHFPIVSDCFWVSLEHFTDFSLVVSCPVNVISGSFWLIFLVLTFQGIALELSTNAKWQLLQNMANFSLISINLDIIWFHAVTILNFIKCIQKLIMCRTTQFF